MKRMRAVGLAAVVVWVGCGSIAGAQANPPKQSLGGAPAPSASATSGKRPMTFADLMAIKRVSDPQISPSGRWVLFSVTDVDLEKNTKTNHLWVVPLGREADSSAAAPLRNDKESGGGPGASGGEADSSVPLRNDKANAGVPPLGPPVGMTAISMASGR
jgi:hypothetical protein